MFERFTGRARHAIVLSQEEARLLNHNYIGTEHVLLGLLGEPESIAGLVLDGFGFTRDSVRREVEKRVGRGQKAPSGHIPFTPRAKKTLELSLREALAIKHNYIGTEHILLGLIREGDGVAVQIMRDQADLADIRAAVIAAVPAGAGEGEEGGGTEDSNTVMRWLRQRLSRHGAASGRLTAEAPGGELAARGTPAAEAVLEQAVRLAGPLPVGSHHLLLAALEDNNSAASLALASAGVDMDELRAKLRAAQVTGTSDEQPEQAGRRQMAIEVTDEILTIVLTDPVIVEAGNKALNAVNARAAAAAKRAAAQGEGGDAEAEPEAEAEAEAEGESATSRVIRGDNPHAAGLASVWLELRKTLDNLVDPTEPTRRRVVLAERPPADWPAGQRPQAEESTPEEPGEATA